jgi:hypothetical protein
VRLKHTSKPLELPGARLKVMVKNPLPVERSVLGLPDVASNLRLPFKNFVKSSVSIAQLMVFPFNGYGNNQ